MSSKTTSSAEAAPPEASTDLNVVVLRGRLSSDPVERTLPSGDSLTTYEVTVRRDEGPADSVPVALVGNRGPRGSSAGDEVLVLGRVRRRFFRAGGATVSRTEVLAERVVRARRTTAVRSALADAALILGTASDPAP